MKYILPCAGLLLSSSFAQQILAHYPLDETAGPTCMDAGPFGYDGTFEGGVGLAVPGAAAGTGTAIELDGIDDFVRLPGMAELDFLDDEFSVTAWVRNDDSAGYRVVFGNANAWVVGTFFTNLRFTTRGILDYIQGPAPTGSWYHLAVTFDANFLASFYVDGQPIGQVQGGGPSFAPAPDWFIGTLDGATELFAGAVDDLQIYEGVLDPLEIADLFANPGSVYVGDVGTTYCSPAVPNTTGLAGVLTATGSATAASNNLELSAGQLPLNQFGIFLVSPTAGFVPMPGGSQGNLCVVGSIGRYNGPGQLQFSGATGTISLVLDLTQTPTPMNPVAIQAGETWHFQCWYRDWITGQGATSNFTDALTVDFE